jgi:hypothetical protein
MTVKTYKDGTPFTGIIGCTTEESSPAWPEPRHRASRLPRSCPAERILRNLARPGGRWRKTMMLEADRLALKTIRPAGCGLIT